MTKPTSKSWCYTINNYTEEEVTALKALTVSKHRCCEEVGDCGTPHLQGSITFTRAYRLTQLRKIFPRAHFEIAKTKDSENYCIKGHIIIDINNNNQGHRSDLEAVHQTIISSTSLDEVVQQHPTQCIKYPTGIQFVFRRTRPYIEKWAKTSLTVIIGPTRVGKTSYVHKLEPILYTVPPISDGKMWFDDYQGEEAILIDDFYGEITYSLLLRYTDGHAINLPVKGGHVRRNYTRIYITSNSPVKTWYPNIRDRSAFDARITDTINMKKVDDCERRSEATTQ